MTHTHTSPSLHSNEIKTFWKVQDVESFKEAYVMFQKLQSSPQGQDPSFSKFAPSQLFLSSMKRLLDMMDRHATSKRNKKDSVQQVLESEATSAEEVSRVVQQQQWMPESGTSRSSSTTTTSITPQLVIQKRNSRGGRVRFVSTCPDTAAATTTTTFTTIAEDTRMVTPTMISTSTCCTPRNHSTRRKKATKRRYDKSILDQNMRKEDGYWRSKDQLIGLSSACGSNIQPLSVAVVKNDVDKSSNRKFHKNDNCDENDEIEDFAFHSQSSLPATDC